MLAAFSSAFSAVTRSWVVLMAGEYRKAGIAWRYRAAPTSPRSPPFAERRFTATLRVSRASEDSLVIPRTPEPVRPAAPAPLRAVLLDPVPRRGQRQPVQVRVHGARDVPAAERSADAADGRARDRRAVHPA